jgi:hypothetical protein
VPRLTAAAEKSSILYEANEMTGRRTHEIQTNLREDGADRANGCRH